MSAAAPLVLARAAQLARLRMPVEWDVVIIGGGATGLGCALDAAARGLRTVVLDGGDFAHATSSRSTKLIHGGVRYLAQMNFSLVREGLRERALLLRNGPPGLVHARGFMIPAYRWRDLGWFGAGLRLYDLLAGAGSLGPSRLLGRDGTLALAPGLALQDGAGRTLKGAVHYLDGQFDDSRLAISLMRTAALHGAVPLNYCAVTALNKRAGTVCGVVARDGETGETFELRARVVINAGGVWVDAVRALDDPAAPPLVAPSAGAHIVLDRDFLPGECALLLPRTEDGRVLFCIPWLGKTLVGTTDTACEALSAAPAPSEAEIDFLLAGAGQLLARRPTRADIRAQFAGLRPLVRGAAATPSARLSREHAIVAAPSGLVSVAGGKWTTYRKMACEAVDLAVRTAALGGPPSRTRDLRLLALDYAGARGTPLHAGFPYTDEDVRNSYRFEMARVADDILLRRTRLGFLDSAAAEALRPQVEALLADCRAAEATGG